MQRLIRGKIYYGWWLVPVGTICYGLGIAPAFGSWGFFAPELRDELGLSRTDIGSVYGTFLLFLMATGPIAAYVINRFGLRFSITFGSLLAAFGMWQLSQAGSIFDCYLWYSVITGTGLAMSTAFAWQTLATLWFKRYRARAMAVILAGGTGVGTVIALVNAYLLQYGWRYGWQVYALVSLGVAVLAAIFVRDTPEKCGLAIDGDADAAREADRVSQRAATIAAGPPPLRRVRDTVLTPQFMLITLCALGQMAPFTVFKAHGRQHTDDLLIAAATAGVFLSVINMASTVGRLLGVLADFFSPRRFLAISMAIEACGFAGIALSENVLLIGFWSILFGLGYGVSMLCVPLSFAEIFGRDAFATTAGTSKIVQGFFNFGAPIAAGAMADRWESYTIPFLWLSAFAFVGAIGILFCQPVRRHQPEVVAENNALQTPVSSNS